DGNVEVGGQADEFGSGPAAVGQASGEGGGRKFDAVSAVHVGDAAAGGEGANGGADDPLGLIQEAPQLTRPRPGREGDPASPSQGVAKQHRFATPCPFSGCGLQFTSLRGARGEILAIGGAGELFADQSGQVQQGGPGTVVGDDVLRLPGGVAADEDDVAD